MNIYEMFPRIYWTKRNPMETIEDKKRKLVEETTEVLIANDEAELLDEALDAMHCCVEIIRDYPSELVDQSLLLHNSKNRKRGYYDPKSAMKSTTCKNVSEYHEADQFICSECGIHLEDWVEVWFDEDFGYSENEIRSEYTMRYCPNCGRKIVE